MRSSAVSFSADELSDSSFSAFTLLLLFSVFVLADFVDCDRREFRLKLILLNRISDNRVDNGVTPGGGGEYFRRFEAGGAGIDVASSSTATATLMYRGLLKYESVILLLPNGFIVLEAIVGPPGEYSRSNVGNVDAYKAGVAQTDRFGAAAPSLGELGGVFGNGRFRDGVVFGVTLLLGVKFRTSRNANSNFD